MDLSVLVLAFDDAGSTGAVVAEMDRTVRDLNLSFEIIVIGEGFSDGTREAALRGSDRARVIRLSRPGYGVALQEGFRSATGDFLLTMEEDLSNDPEFIAAFWSARNDAEVLIGSRCVPSGDSASPRTRNIGRRALDFLWRRGLSLSCQDPFSGFRMYRSSVVKSVTVQNPTVVALLEVLVATNALGYRIKEVPVTFRPGRPGGVARRRMPGGFTHLKAFWSMWRLRNSIDSADYDDRAYESIIPPQRYWQRRRCSLLKELTKGGSAILDIGCGSSRFLALSTDLVGLDIRLNKLRYARKFHRPLVNGSILSLPFRDASFDCVVCSEVIEHLPGGAGPFREIRRVLKPGGILVIGTPDYDHLAWRVIEAVYGFVVPGGYAEEHITHYTRESLSTLLNELGFRVLRTEYILHSEMILRCAYEIPAGTSPSGRMGESASVPGD